MFISETDTVSAVFGSDRTETNLDLRAAVRVDTGSAASAPKAPQTGGASMLTWGLLLIGVSAAALAIALISRAIQRKKEDSGDERR